MSEVARRYTVHWRRSIEPGAPLECIHLTERDIVRRLIGALANSGSIIIDGVVREPPSSTDS